VNIWIGLPKCRLTGTTEIDTEAASIFLLFVLIVSDWGQHFTGKSSVRHLARCFTTESGDSEYPKHSKAFSINQAQCSRISNHQSYPNLLSMSSASLRFHTLYFLSVIIFNKALQSSYVRINIGKKLMNAKETSDGSGHR